VKPSNSSEKSEAITLRLAAVFTFSLACWLAQMAIADDWTWWPLHVAQVLTAFVLVAAMQVGFLRVAMRVTAVVFAIGLPVLLFMVRAGFADGLGLHAGPRTGLWYGNPNPLGGSLVISAVVAAIAAGRFRWLGLGVLALGTLAATAIQVRGATVAGALAIVVWIWTRYRGRQRVYAFLGTVAVVAVLGAGLTLYDPPGPRGPVLDAFVIQQRFNLFALSDRNQSGGWWPRLRSHRIALSFFAARPIAGIGYSQFDDWYLAEVDPDARHPVANAHNLVFDLMAQGGLLGLLAWAVPIGATLWWARRRWCFLAPLLIAMLWLNTIETALFWSGVFYGYWFAVGWAMFAEFPEHVERDEPAGDAPTASPAA
jgi:O-antigen ligase